jgi:hypothetical protein
MFLRAFDWRTVWGDMQTGSMNMASPIEREIELIREYTDKWFPFATILSYDVLLPRNAQSPIDVAVFGINEAEYPVDQKIRQLGGRC